MESKTTKIHNAPSFATLLSDKEIIKQVKEAQKGPFYTSAQVKEELKKWKSKRA